MNAAHYLIAKYVPDVFRNEPRNIGVVVWTEFEVGAKFFAADESGNVDKRRVPDFVEPKDMYKQWVRFWHAEIQKPKIEFIGSTRQAERSCPEFVEALQTTARGNYFLQDGGVVLEEVRKDNFRKVLDELFLSLVASVEAEEKEDSSEILAEACASVINTSKLAGSKNLKTGKQFMCELEPGVVETFEFDFSYGNGAPVWLGERVPLRKYRSELDRTIDSTAWKFKWATDKLLPREQCAAFIYPTEEQLDDEHVKRAIKVLNSVAPVLNLREADKVRAKLDEIAAVPLGAH